MSTIIRYTKLIVCLLFCLAADAQQKVMIVKRCNFEGAPMFPPWNSICEKIYFNGEEPSAKLTYAINNWQVYDSIVFERTGNENCAIEFRPEYNVDSRTITKYDFVEKECRSYDTLNALLAGIKDKYDLSKSYLEGLSFLLEHSPNRNGDTFSFRDSIIPSLFISYGVPRDELLYAFNFRISDNMIISDKFYHQHHTVARSFSYKDDILQKVEIAVEDKRDGSISKWQEYFSIVNL